MAPVTLSVLSLRLKGILCVKFALWKIQQFRDSALLKFRQAFHYQQANRDSFSKILWKSDFIKNWSIGAISFITSILESTFHLITEIMHTCLKFFFDDPKYFGVMRISQFNFSIV